MFILESPSLEKPKIPDYHFAGEVAEIEEYRQHMLTATTSALAMLDTIDRARANKLAGLLAESTDTIPASLVPTFNHMSEFAYDAAQDQIHDIHANNSAYNQSQAKHDAIDRTERWTERGLENVRII